MPERGRPEPPRSLDRFEKRAWREIVASLPDRWCDLSAQNVLRRAAAQAATAERLEIRLRELRAQDRDRYDEARFSDHMIKETFVEFGQGFKSMSPAWRDVESLVLERKIRHGDHPVLSMCTANAVIASDPAGNWKLDKKRASGRIDGVVALAMALAAAPAAWTQTVDVRALIG